MNYTEDELQALLKITLDTGRIQVLKELMVKLYRYNNSINMTDLLDIIGELLITVKKEN